MDGPVDALVSSRLNAYGSTDVLLTCSHAVSPNMDIQQPVIEQRVPHGFTDVVVPYIHAVNPNMNMQQPRRGLHLYEQRDTHGWAEKLVSTSLSVVNGVVKAAALAGEVDRVPA